MTNSKLLALATSAAFTMLTGCGGSLATGGRSSGLVPQTAHSAPHRIPRIAPTARDKDLLYATSIYNCDVYVFTYPRAKLVQTLNACGLGFGPAFGLCTDRSGDVFMDMGEGFSIFEYVHGASQPIAQLQDDAGLIEPIGCSVDPKTGDLGVASVTGSVVVYKNATGTPTNYSLADISEFFFCTFDDRGNLFADGEHSDGTFALAELPKYGSALREITLKGSLGSGFALQWDGRHIAIEGTQASNEFRLDRIRISGTLAKVVGTTALSGAPNTYKPFQFWVQGNTIVQPENGNVDVGFWKYPHGGQPIKSIPLEGATLSGVTVSVSPPRH